MSRQSTIVNYFKSRASTQSSPKIDVKPDMSDKKVRKRNLSLIKPLTPTKSPKLSDKSAVIDLCSDDDDIFENTQKLSRSPCIDLTQRSNESEPASDLSQNTVVYSPETPLKILTPAKKQTPLTPSKQLGNSQHSLKSDCASTTSSPTKYLNECVKLEEDKDTPSTALLKTPLKSLQGAQTPRKTPQLSQSIQPSTSKSPQSKNKFFSPVRKKSVKDRTPMKVKRSLTMELSRTLPISSRILFEDDLYANACEGIDDNTKFLIDIINKCLNEPGLKELLQKDSQELLMNCLQVVKPGMFLINRLFWRKPGWYKEEQISKICRKKDETMDSETLQSMVSSLVENKLLVQSNAQNMTFDDFIIILKREDLKQICKDLKLKMESKQTAIDALKEFSKKTYNISTFFTGHTSSNASRVLQMMSSKAGPCFKLSDLTRDTLHKLYIIMYLGMDYSIIRDRKLELVLLYDKIQRETYPVSKDMELDSASLVFRTRDNFERYVSAHNIYEDLLTRTDVSEKCAIVKQVYDVYKSLRAAGGFDMESYSWLPQWLHRYTPGYIYVKILEQGIQELKKDKEGGHYLLALDILSSLIKQSMFRQHKKAEWYAEKALILHNILHRSDEAAEVLIEGFKSCLSEEAKDRMRPRAKKIANQKNITLSEHLKLELIQHATKEAILENNIRAEHIHKQPMDRIVKRGKVKFETNTHEEKIVQECEDYCIYHYLSTGEFTHGEHWEGRIITSIFFLLFWDIIYSQPTGARGVFLSHYQLFPLDLFTDSFYKNRREKIEDWLRAIETASEGKLLNLLQDTWTNRPETELSGINRPIGLEKIKSVAMCLGPRGVAAICRRLAVNYHYSHSGFPDVTLWNIHTRRIKFVEVKTDSDKPSMKQIQWMQYLRQHNIETEFCYIGVNTTRQRSRNTQQNSPTTPSKKRKHNRRKTTVKNESKSEVKQESLVKTEI